MGGSELGTGLLWVLTPSTWAPATHILFHGGTRVGWLVVDGDLIRGGVTSVCGGHHRGVHIPPGTSLEESMVACEGRYTDLMATLVEITLTATWIP